MHKGKEYEEWNEVGFLWPALYVAFYCYIDNGIAAVWNGRACSVLSAVVPVLSVLDG